MGGLETDRCIADHHGLLRLTVALREEGERQLWTLLCDGAPRASGRESRGSDTARLAPGELGEQPVS